MYSAQVCVCLTCGNEFTPRGAYKSYTPKYCSIACYSKRKIDDSTREKQSAAKKGVTPWNKGIAMWADREHPRGTLGMKFDKAPATDETKRKLSLSHKGKKYPSHSGSNHWNWRGGISSENDRIRNSPEYKDWRLSVFKRDNYTCQECGRRGCEIHADHIVPFSIDESKRFDIDNGRTLCVECHRKTDTYGSKALNYG